MADVGAWLVAVFERGGPVMYPLLLTSLVGVALSFERAVFWTRTHGRAAMVRFESVSARARAGDVSGAAVVAGRDRSVYGLVASALLARVQAGTPPTEADAREVIESARGPIERSSALMSTIITAAPMLGILGTVTGIIQSFGLLGSSDRVTDPALVAGGIAEALYTTAFGLIIALAVLFPYTWARAHADRAFSRLETFAAVTIEAAATVRAVRGADESGAVHVVPRRPSTAASFEQSGGSGSPLNHDR